jgi:hypothetical protein
MIFAATTPGQARRDARAILEGESYRTKTGARPLRGVLRWVGDRLDPIGRALTRVWRATVGQLPPTAMWIVVIALVAGAIYLIARNAQSRAAAHSISNPTYPSDDRFDTLTAVDLEAEATSAEQRGDLALAIRLRFRAGLLRLEHDAHAIVNRPGLTTREVRSALQLGQFDSLANTFERVAYGNQIADDNATNEARAQWPGVIREASRG